MPILKQAIALRLAPVRWYAAGANRMIDDESANFHPEPTLGWDGIGGRVRSAYAKARFLVGNQRRLTANSTLMTWPADTHPDGD
mgnify:CR=1 FL=1